MKEKKDKKGTNRGTNMMFVGYPPDRESRSFRMYNPKTNGVVTMRYVIWLNQMYYEDRGPNKKEVEKMAKNEDDK